MYTYVCMYVCMYTFMYHENRKQCSKLKWNYAKLY